MVGSIVLRDLDGWPGADPGGGPRFAGESSLARAPGFNQRDLWRGPSRSEDALAALPGVDRRLVFSVSRRFLAFGFLSQWLRSRSVVGGVGSFAGPVAGAGVIGTLSAHCRG